MSNTAAKAEVFDRYGTAHGKATVDKNGRAIVTVVEACSRCGGAGGSDAWRFTGWTCYQCGGNCTQTRYVKAYTAEKNAKLDAAQAKRDAKREAKEAALAAARKAEADARRDAFTSANEALVWDIAAEAEGHHFLTEMLERIEEEGALTFGQAAGAQRAIAGIRAERERIANQVYVGEVGKRMTLTVTAQAWIEISKHPIYGTRYLVRMTDENGNLVVYFGDSNEIPAIGETSTIKATPSEHSEYKGEKQTIIKRPKEVVAKDATYRVTIKHSTPTSELVETRTFDNRYDARGCAADVRDMPESLNSEGERVKHSATITKV